MRKCVLVVVTSSNSSPDYNNIVEIGDEIISTAVLSLLLIQVGQLSVTICEPGHEKMCPMSYVNNKGADQPAHPGSLISSFVVRCLDSIISLDSIAEISRL